MARRSKRGNDFWDDNDQREDIVDEIGNFKAANIDENDETAKKTAPRPIEEPMEAADEYMEEDDEGWTLTNSMAVKVIVRILMFAAAAVVGISGFVTYKYLQDRYVGDAISNNYTQSVTFTDEYDSSMTRLIRLIQQIESEPTSLEPENAELLSTLVENYMGKDTNFNFVIYNDQQQQVVASGEDAVTRFESSSAQVKVSTLNGGFEVQSTLGRNLNQENWQTAMSVFSGSYNIYTSVDNDLANQDGFYTGLQQYNKYGEYFGIAKIAGIVAFVIFLILFIFSVVATGVRRGYAEVYLSLYDKIFTEVALAFSAVLVFAVIYGIIWLRTRTGSAATYGIMGCMAVLYIILIRTWFSVVRRIKAGRLVRNSLCYGIIGGICTLLSKLGPVAGIIIGAILLLAVNGGLLYAAFAFKQYTFKGIPVGMVAAPIIAIIEILCIVTWFSGTDEFDDEEEEDLPEEDDTEAVSKSLASGENQIWEAQEAISKSVQEVTDQDVMRAASEPAQDKTTVLSVEEVQSIIKASTAGAATAQTVAQTVEQPVALSQEDDGKVNFALLNKEVRKEHRIALKAKSIGVTVRAPEKPIIIDIDRSSLHIAVSNIYEVIERFAAPESRAFVELYKQKGRIIYIVKVILDESMNEEAAQFKGNGSNMLDKAKKIIQANGGKFVTSVDGDLLKIGILLDSAE